MPRIMDMSGFLTCQSSQWRLVLEQAALIFEIELFILIW